jgi:hypothetical protein
LASFFRDFTGVKDNSPSDPLFEVWEAIVGPALKSTLVSFALAS